MTKANSDKKIEKEREERRGDRRAYREQRGCIACSGAIRTGFLGRVGRVTDISAITFVRHLGTLSLKIKLFFGRYSETDLGKKVRGTL